MIRGLEIAVWLKSIRAVWLPIETVEDDQTVAQVVSRTSANV